jgi:hypothetical protein
MKRAQRCWFQAARLFVVVCLAPDVSAQEDSQAGIAEATQDRIEIRHEVDRLVVDVYRVKGIGRARVSAPPRAGWPPAMIVRLHGFPELESFTAVSTTAKLECALIRLEGGQPIQFCKFGGAPIDALWRELDYFEVELPRALLAPDSGPIAVEWVDQWR